MAVPSYTTDLTDIADLDTTGGTAVEPASLYTAGRGPDEADVDFPIQGTVHASLTMNATGKAGILVPGTTFTHTSGEYIFGWIIWLSPASINTYADAAGAGLVMLLGSSASVFDVHYVGGSDFGKYPYGGWQNFAVDPERTPDENAGTPTAYHYVGAGANVHTKVNKGNPLGFDVFRYGRGEARIDAGQAGSLGTFGGLAAVNDANTARWGLFQEIGVNSFQWKGLMTFGSVSACLFTDSNVSINIENAELVSSDFNRIEINNTSSVINWTNISFTALGTTSKGELEMIDNAEFNDTDGSFTNMGTFTYLSNYTATRRTWRGCDLVTQGGGTFDSCTFDNSISTASILVDDLDLVYDCSFSSDGSNHAIELTSAHAAGTFDLAGGTFTGYATADGSTGNEVIYNNSGGAVTINASDITGTISIRNGTSATTNLVLNPVATHISVKDGDADPIENARVLVWVTDNSNYFSGATVTITGSGTTATVAHTAHGMVTGDYVTIAGVTNDDTYNGQYSVTVTGVNAYTYTTNESINIGTASGTITSTFVVLSALSSALGIASDTRSWSVDQPIAGRVRKSTASPFYVTSTFTGTIDKDTGFTTIIQMVSDE